MRGHLRLASLLSIALLRPGLSVGSAHAIQTHAPFPAALDSYLSSTARLSDAERADLSAGKPVAKLLDADPNSEIAVFGAVWVGGGTAADYARRLSDIETFERGGPFIVTKKLSDPPIAEDFSSLVLPEPDVRDLRSCKVGNCELKLGEKGIEVIRAGVDWKKPAAAAEANALVRSLALELVTAYRQRGNDGLAVYRDKSRPTFVGKEFRAMADALPAFDAMVPDLKQYLIEYPRAKLANVRDVFFWQQAQFGAKTTITINHMVVQQQDDRTIVASKLLYSSHYFWTALGIRALLPDPVRGRGFWLVAVSRCRSDGLSGFTGKFVRGRARGDAQKAVLAQLTRAKDAYGKG